MVTLFLIIQMTQMSFSKRLLYHRPPRILVSLPVQPFPPFGVGAKDLGKLLIRETATSESLECTC